MRLAPLLRLAAALLACSLMATAGAASLQISPVSLNLRPDQGAAGIALQNMGDAPIYGQVRVYAWDQKDGEDVLTPTTLLVASPPIVQIGARASQTIRLVRTGANAPGGPGELTFRVLIDEVSRDDAGQGSGIDIKLRYSVPVFVLAQASAAEVLTWQVARQADGWHLTVTNRGQRHAQIGALSFANAAGKQFSISKGLFGYVLAGRARSWLLPVAADADLAGTLAIQAVINAKPLVASNAKGD
jgi:fimbrial chaperone protein